MGWDDFGIDLRSFFPSSSPSSNATNIADSVMDFSGADVKTDPALTFDSDCFMPPSGEAATSSLADVTTIDWSFDSSIDLLDPLAGTGIGQDDQVFNSMLDPYGLGTADMSSSLNFSSLDWGITSGDYSSTTTFLDEADPNCSIQDPTYLTPGSGPIDDGLGLLYQGGVQKTSEAAPTVDSKKEILPPGSMAPGVSAPAGREENKRLAESPAVNATDVGQQEAMRLVLNTSDHLYPQTNLMPTYQKQMPDTGVSAVDAFLVASAALGDEIAANVFGTRTNGGYLHESGRVDAVPGVMVLAAHGNSAGPNLVPNDTYEGGKFTAQSPGTIAMLIAARPDYSPSTPIYIDSCNVAGNEKKHGNDDWIKKLSEKLPNPIVAAPGYASYNGDGYAIRSDDLNGDYRVASNKVYLNGIAIPNFAVTFNRVTGTFTKVNN